MYFYKVMSIQCNALTCPTLFYVLQRHAGSDFLMSNFKRFRRILVLENIFHEQVSSHWEMKRVIPHFLVKLPSTVNKPPLEQLIVRV